MSENEQVAICPLSGRRCSNTVDDEVCAVLGFAGSQDDWDNYSNCFLSIIAKTMFDIDVIVSEKQQQNERKGGCA